MLLFKKKFLELIRAGEKTQSIRIWPYRKMKVGQRSYIPGAGYIRIEAVDAVQLAELTDDDAARDGFANAAALLAEIALLYPEGLNPPEGKQLQAYRIRFQLLSPEEQAVAIAERRAKKQKSTNSQAK